jgi:hypothetical protein
MALRLKFDVVGGETLLVQATKELPGAVRTSVKQVGALFAGYMAEEAPVDTGRLAGSISFRMVGQYEGKATAGSTNVEYAPDVAFGTKPHVIRPRSAKVLAFVARAGKNAEGRQLYQSAKTGKSVVTKSRGKMIFARAVNHPGTKANPFHDRAAARTMPEIPRVVEQALRSAGVL